MLRISIRHVAETAKSPMRYRSFRSALYPRKPSARANLSAASLIAFDKQVKNTPALLTSTLKLCHEQPGKAVALSDHFQQQQLRPFHTSRPLYARASFGARMKDKLTKLRKDEGAMQKLMGVGAMGYTVAKVSKFGAVAKFAFPILKLTKAMPLMSMGLSTLFYSWFFGLPFAVGIVSLLATSQAARAAVLSKLGCEVQPMMMIPFFGTMSTGSEQTDHTKTEEYVLRDKPFQRCLVALSPVAGMFLFTAVAPLGVGGLLLNSQCGYAVANTGFMMGMFSLLPLGEMTPGGLLLSHFSKNALMYGTVFNLALCPLLQSPILYLCLVLNMYRLYQRGFVVFGRQFGGTESEPNYETGSGLTINVFSDQHKITIAGLYWALFVLNAGGLAFVGKSLLAPQRLREQAMQEEQERRFNLDPNQLSPDSFGTDSGGWNVGNWALDSLNTVEELDHEDDAFDQEWYRQQQLAAQSVRPGELFRG